MRPNAIRRLAAGAGETALAGVLLLAAAPAAAPRAYANDFSDTPLGPVPDSTMVLDGTFTIVNVEGNRCMELAGDPIGSFAALLGPAFGATVDVKARVWAASTGKRFPEFGIGTGDAGGFRLFLAPGRHVLEIRNGEATQATAPAQWTSAAWTWLRLRIEPQGPGQWIVRGKAWPAGQAEPSKWSVTTRTTTAPPTGRVSFWGEDFSEKPIRFDDLSVSAVQ